MKKLSNGIIYLCEAINNKNYFCTDGTYFKTVIEKYWDFFKSVLNYKHFKQSNSLLIFDKEIK